MLHGWDSGFIVYFTIITMPKNNKTDIKAILIYHKYLVESGLD